MKIHVNCGPLKKNLYCQSPNTVMRGPYVRSANGGCRELSGDPVIAVECPSGDHNESMSDHGDAWMA